MEPVLKTGDVERHRGFESYLFRHNIKEAPAASSIYMESYSRGRRGRFAKPLVSVRVARVRIPHSPPKNTGKVIPVFFIYLNL